MNMKETLFLGIPFDELESQNEAEERIKEARRAYHREWAKNNPDKVKAYQDRFFARQAERQNREAPEDEKIWREANLRTQGKKGCKAKRINLAFKTANHEYVCTMSRIRGESFTRFVNYIIEKHMQEHLDAYKKAKELLKSDLL